MAERRPPNPKWTGRLLEPEETADAAELAQPPPWRASLGAWQSELRRPPTPKWTEPRPRNRQQADSRADGRQSETAEETDTEEETEEEVMAVGEFVGSEASFAEFVRDRRGLLAPHRSYGSLGSRTSIGSSSSGFGLGDSSVVELPWRTEEEKGALPIPHPAARTLLALVACARQFALLPVPRCLFSACSLAHHLVIHCCDVCARARANRSRRPAAPGERCEPARAHAARGELPRSEAPITCRSRSSTLDPSACKLTCCCCCCC
eukprot:COSAG05_NODE_245_length_12989_cov_32.994725_7_plen_264_part_00